MNIGGIAEEKYLLKYNIWKHIEIMIEKEELKDWRTGIIMLLFKKRDVRIRFNYLKNCIV